MTVRAPLVLWAQLYGELLSASVLDGGYGHGSRCSRPSDGREEKEKEEEK